METTVLQIEGMSCDHCVAAVTGALRALAGVADVAVELAAGTASVAYDPATTSRDDLAAAVEEQGFDVVG